MKDCSPQHPRDDEISAIDARLAELETEKTLLLQQRRTFLENRTQSSVIPLTPDQKVSLFQSLFRGREDVFEVQGHINGLL